MNFNKNRSVAIGTKLHEFVIPCLNKYKPDLIKETFLTSQNGFGIVCDAIEQELCGYW